ncbi:hypothetical protein CEXT_371681 [Caerostris extrusa]|uniref:Uncharacterized protein n=1 Tax=Caerostris extrusa TaxID=172846 RepID=A0AAV4PRP4_CAEEX|nr:hypothetical protein CEXT_371681 [Caerostris extrusa]
MGKYFLEPWIQPFPEIELEWEKVGCSDGLFERRRALEIAFTFKKDVCKSVLSSGSFRNCFKTNEVFQNWEPEAYLFRKEQKDHCSGGIMKRGKLEEEGKIKSLTFRSV